MVCPNTTSFQQGIHLINFSRTDDLEIRLQIVRLWCTKILIPIVCLIGISANTLNIIILAKPKMLSSTNCYLFAVAVCDLFYEAILILLVFRTHPQLESYVIYMSLVPYIMALGNSFSNIVGWLTCAFTVERYVAVTFPMHARKWCTAERSKLIILILVVIVFIVTLPDFFLRRIEWHEDSKIPIQINSQLDNNFTTARRPGKYVLRETNFSKQMSQIGWPLITILQAYVLPLIILSVFNGLLVRSVIKASNDRKRLASKRCKSFKAELQIRNGGLHRSIKTATIDQNLGKVTMESENIQQSNQPKRLVSSLFSQKRIPKLESFTQNEMSGIYSGCTENESLCLNQSDCQNHSRISQIDTTDLVPQSGNICLDRSNVTARSQRSAERTSFGERQKITLMLILVVLVFCVFTMPSAVIHLTRELYPTDVCRHVDLNFKILGNFANLALAINSSLNFFLYSWLSSTFRGTFCSLLKCQRV